MPLSRFIHKPAFAVCLLSAGVIAAAAPPPPAASDSSRQTHIGDVQIRAYQSFSFKGDLSSTTVTGPETLLTVPEKKSKSVTRLHADTIRSHKVGKDPAGQIDLLTNVRFHIDRENGSSASGTATEGHYNRAEHKLTLLDAHVTAIDPKSLDGPAALIASRIVVDMTQEPYTYTLTGDPGTNSIHATPISRKKHPSTGESDVTKSEIYLTKFRNAEFQAGSHATADGAGTTFTLHDAAGRKDTLMRATHLQAKFNSAEPPEVVSATAQEEVYFKGSRATQAGDTDTLTAKGDVASYDSGRDRAEISGHVTAEIQSPASLKEPGHIQARSLAVTFAAPETYDIAGGPNASHLDFVPKPRPAAKPTDKPAAPGATAPQPIRVTVTGFERALYTPTASLDVTGSSTIFEALNLTTSEVITLATPHVTGKMNNLRELLTADAAGGVEFRERMPATSKHSERTINGHSATAVYNTQVNPSSLALNGPLKIDVTDPDNLETPGHLSGQTGDTVTAYSTQAGYDYDMSSPAQTLVLDLTPRTRAETNATPASPRKTKPVKKQGKQRGDKN